MDGALDHNTAGQTTVCSNKSLTEEKLEHSVKPPDSVHDLQSLEEFLQYVDSKDGIGTALEKTITFNVPVSAQEVNMYLEGISQDPGNSGPPKAIDHESVVSACNIDCPKDPTYIPALYTKRTDPEHSPYVPLEGTKLKSPLFPILWGTWLVFGSSSDAKATLIGNPDVGLVWKTKKTSRNYMINHPTTKFIEPVFIQEVTAAMRDPNSEEYCDTVFIFRKHKFEEWGFRLRALNGCWCSGLKPKPANTRKHQCTNAFYSVPQAVLLFGRLLAFSGVLACAGLSLLSPSVNAATVDEMEGINRDNLLLLALVLKLCPFAITFYENSPNIITSLGATVMESVYRTSVYYKRSVTVVLINTKHLGGPASNQDRKRSGIYTTPDAVYGEGGFVVESYQRPQYTPQQTARHAMEMQSGKVHVRDPLSTFIYVHMKVLRTVFREEGKDPKNVKVEPSFLPTYNKLCLHGSQRMSVGMAELLVHDMACLNRAVVLVENLLHKHADTTATSTEKQTLVKECAAILKNYKRLQNSCAEKSPTERRKIAIAERRDFPEINYNSMNKTIVGSMANNLVDGSTFQPIEKALIASNMSQPHSTVIGLEVEPIEITRDMPGSFARDTVYTALSLMKLCLHVLLKIASTDFGKLISTTSLSAIERMPTVIKAYCSQNETSPVPNDIKISRSQGNFVLHTALNQRSASVYQSFTGWALSVGHTNVNKSSSIGLEVNKFGVDKYITFADPAHKKFVAENKELLISALKKAHFTPATKLLMADELAYSKAFVTAFWATLLATRVAHLMYTVWQLRNGYVSSVMGPPTGDVCTYVSSSAKPEEVVALIRCPLQALQTFKENGKIINLYTSEAVAEYEKLSKELPNTVL